MFHHSNQTRVIRLSSSKDVTVQNRLPDWAIFERPWGQIFLQKLTKLPVTSWANWENVTFKQKTAVATFWQFLKNRATFVNLLSKVILFYLVGDFNASSIFKTWEIIL